MFLGPFHKICRICGTSKVKKRTELSEMGSAVSRDLPGFGQIPGRYHICRDINGKRFVLLPGGKKQYYEDCMVERIIYPNGKEEYYIHGKFSRLDGPAIIHPCGKKEYYVDGIRHRSDGPAIIHSCGKKEYYIDGKLVTAKNAKRYFSNKKKQADGTA